MGADDGVILPKIEFTGLQRDLSHIETLMVSDRWKAIPVAGHGADRSGFRHG
jgi:hypothetical protein